ncbi:thioredoxin family protein [Halalkalibacterium halodurans]|uniref:thioredoxin family protein n=1 Tax=Halalkalibacterium halodurans TaxID=86665 RepID=UPI002AA9C49B|nr:thioredoxin family protein [Halalkalibacterium halodurans]MDY7223785.1 thioredoxin family protein [Halalkalibacterium halodurans]MDY7243006.1 thioredoxin family protein [Halalkalibacterium halodurans]
MEQIKTLEQFQQVKNQENVVFLFSADWCPDCRVIEPFLPELEQTYDEYQFYYVNRDDFIELCQELDIFGIPSFLFYSNGEERSRFVSKDRKTKEEIDRFLTEAKQA